MITADPQLRASRLREVMAILEGDANDRELRQAFTTTVFNELPDTVALRLDGPALAAELREYFEFVARTMPPPDQLYRGLPGLHVAARNRPGDQDESIVETHTPHVPFIFESLKSYFQNQSLRVFSAVRPVFTVRRRWERVVSIGGPVEDGPRELYCRFRMEHVESAERLRRIEHQILAVLKSVFLAVEDFSAMSTAVRDLSTRLTTSRGSASEARTTREFLDWLLANNYVFMGLARYRSDGGTQLYADAEAALGLFKDPTMIPVVYPGLLERQQQLIQQDDRSDRVLSIDYGAGASAIHQLDPLDDIVIREWRSDGRLAVKTWLVGRFSKSVMSAGAQEIPLLKEKLAWLLEHSGAARNSHAYRETRALFNRVPKRELFYADEAAIKSIIDRMIHVSSDDDIAVTARAGAGYHAVCAAFSNINYSHQAAEQLASALADAIGPISSQASADCGSMALLIFYFEAATLTHPIDLERVRAIVRDVTTTWEVRAAAALEQAYGPTEGRRLFRRYVNDRSRSGLYRETTPAEQVPEDVRRLDRLESRLEVRVIPESTESVTVKLFSPTPLELVDTIRTFEHLGLNVREQLSIPITLPDGRRAFIERLRIEAPAAVVTSIAEDEDNCIAALRALHEGVATNDPLNGLVLGERLGWRDVDLLRTLRNHLLQIRSHYTADTTTAVLLRNSAVARALFQAFAARFDPALTDRDQAIAAEDERLAETRQRVTSLLDDEILQSLENLMRAIVRTNFYQRPERPVLSIKVDSARVDRMASPRPLFEIYVHSRLLEGIHLRGGRVARGGLRWSDRHDDFRTEILGLMQTQMLKNSIIVPVGSKGGFVLKGRVPSRPALDAYLVERYREFVSGLLDVTDTIAEGGVLHPPSVVRYDEDDPYLVVAADKGTAHLSDTANQVSQQYGFWLRDAFASGGTHGYDHKKQAITARGAWVSVRNHLRYIGLDPDQRPFTVVGIGDMSGDVFGNGLLQSRKIQLLAAFNAHHIFIDPQPDPERSFVERERLFRLPRSTWRDYDPAILSEGGGVYDRQAKVVPLSSRTRQWLALGDEPVSGEDVIRRLLTAPVDLLYNGGIGTYVKASSETDAEVGDRTNDRVRVDAKQVRARVVAEGGNLGLTQKARIEYWIAGGCINTDAVDNSGGVDMSDHEVNIKILLDLLVNRGVLAGRMERNELLAQMSEAVAELVLQDNANQVHALDLDGLRSVDRFEEFIALIADLIARRVMHRLNDAVPPREDLMALARDRGIPRPLLAVMLGRVKNWAYEQLIKSRVVDTPAAAGFLTSYFPAQLRERFGEYFELHPLRREIIATGAVNCIVNQAGVTFLPRMMAATSQDVGAIVAAYLAATPSQAPPL
jgi:glutamate dehydrogenase